MATPPVGYMDPTYLAVMQETKELLRYVFKTKNEFTIPISGTGSAGMETALCNFIEPSDDVLIAIHGFFGERLADMATRYGAKVDRIEKPWGEIFTPEELDTALSKKKYKLLAIVHGETSTGCVQTRVDEIATAAHKHGALLVLDTVASLGGVPIDIDGWDVDICYSGSQKCLSAPPGLAPITIGSRAWEALEKRRTPVANWYLDITGINRYWGDSPAYHHTGPSNMVFALREALRIIAEEGLDACLQRHRVNAELLWAGLEDLGVPPRVPLDYRMASLTTAQLHDGFDEAAVRSTLLHKYNVEIVGGFGPLAGQIWRIGLMGYSSRREHVELLLALLKKLL
jgi:alanine-glyoxylate transaminase/serine-glyoxylate transaminase/serine-pyruvate transaminase